MGTRKVNLSGIKVTTSQTLGEANFILADASGGDITLTLPPAASLMGRVYVIERINPVSRFSVIVARSQNDRINGLKQDIILSQQFASVYLISDGINNWIRVL